MYRLASRKPGSIAAAYSRTTDTDAAAEYTISMIEGGIRMPSVPPAQMTPAESR